MVKLTVLMPVYNAEKYLEDAINSIINQTFRDFEFLIIDDGSTDSSKDIIHSYNDSRIRLVSNKQNLGISKTLNKGIELASAELIARMDADDISLPERLGRQFAIMNEHPEYALVSTDIEKITADGESLQFISPERDFMYFYLIFQCYGIYHPTVMYRKQAVKDVGMYPLTLSEDFRLWSKLIRKYRFFHIPELLVRYRVTDQSISHSVRYQEYRDNEKNYIIDNLKYFAGEDYSIPGAWLEAYRNNATPLSNPPDIIEMIRCINELDVITPHVLSKENVNRDKKNIALAADQKKKDVFELFFNNIPTIYKLKLLYKTGKYRKIGIFMNNWVKKKSVNFFRSAD